MTRATTKQTAPQTPPLLPLEYCTPERAARLLECEVEDLYHWVEMGVIPLYAEFNGHLSYASREIITARRVYCFGDIVGVKSFHGKILERTPPERIIITDDCFSSRNKYAFTIDTSFEGDEAFRRHGLISHDAHFEGYINKGADCKYISLTPNDKNGADIIVLEGFWRVRGIKDYRLKHYESHEVSWDIECSVPSQYCMLIQDLNIDYLENHFRFKQADIQALYYYINTGQTLNAIHHNDNEELPNKSTLPDESAAIPKERVTRKQCRYIVDLLKARGITDDDFKGSIEVLRLKIANKIPEVGAPCVDNKTLIDWLEKGGVR